MLREVGTNEECTEIENCGLIVSLSLLQVLHVSVLEFVAGQIIIEKIESL